MEILGKKVRLRAIESQDLELLHKWSNDPEICQMLGGWHFPSSTKDQQEWFQRLTSNSLHQRFAVITPDLGLIGMANIVEINWKDRNAFHGMLLGDIDMRGKGYGVDTIMAIMRYAFEELGLERLDGSMIEYNEASLAVYTKKCGWKIEGYKNKAYFRQGKFWKKVIVGITKDEYHEHIRATDYWNS